MVRWNQVPAFMHLHPETGLSGEGAEEREASPAAGGGYRGTAEEDKELQAIFERTYGPVRPRTFRQEGRPRVNGRAMDSAEPQEEPREMVLPAEQTEYLLVDGYNIIFAWPDLKAMAQSSLEDARNSLIRILSNYRGFHPCELILVFDAYRVHRNPCSREETAGIHIVYTREAETADNYIEKTIRRIARKKESRVRVATSDGLEQVIILGGGALRESAEEFRREVEAANVEISRILESALLTRERNAGMALAYQEAEARKAEKDHFLQRRSSSEST